MAGLLPVQPGPRAAAGLAGAQPVPVEGERLGHPPCTVKPRPRLWQPPGHGRVVWARAAALPSFSKPKPGIWASRGAPRVGPPPAARGGPSPGVAGGQVPPEGGASGATAVTRRGGVRPGSRRRAALRDGRRLLCHGEGMRPRELDPWQADRCSWADVSSHPGATASADALPRASSVSARGPGGHETRALVPGGREGRRDSDRAGTERAQPLLARGGHNRVRWHKASTPLCRALRARTRLLRAGQREALPHPPGPSSPPESFRSSALPAPSSQAVPPATLCSPGRSGTGPSDSSPTWGHTRIHTCAHSRHRNLGLHSGSSSVTSGRCLKSHR